MWCQSHLKQQDKYVILVKGTGKILRALVLMFKAFKYTNSIIQINEYLKTTYKDSTCSRVGLTCWVWLQGMGHGWCPSGYS